MVGASKRPRAAGSAGPARRIPPAGDPPPLDGREIPEIPPRIFPFSGLLPLIGMVHLAPLPGSPRFAGEFEPVVARAVRDARRLADAGFDGILVENYGDLPFHPRSVPPVTIAAMTAILAALRDAVTGSVVWGVNVLRNDAAAALSIAAVTGAGFIRVNVHTGATVTDQGILEGKADETLRLRQAIAPQVAILADARVKHGRSLTAGSLGDEVRDLVERGLADAVLVTGSRTGSAPDLDEVRGAVAAADGVPVLVASGVTPASAASYLGVANGLIVGTVLKRGGTTASEIEPARAGRLVDIVRAFRESIPAETRTATSRRSASRRTNRARRH